MGVGFDDNLAKVVEKLRKEPKSLSLGPARDYLDVLLTEVSAMFECVNDAKNRWMQEQAQMKAAAAAAALMPISTNNEAPVPGASILGSSALMSLVEDTTNPIAPPTLSQVVPQRFCNAVQGYRTVLTHQSVSMDLPSDPSSRGVAAEEKEQQQEEHNIRVVTSVARMSQKMTSFIRSKYFEKEMMEFLDQPPTEETVLEAEIIVKETVDMVGAM